MREGVCKGESARVKIHCVAEGLQNWDFPVDLAKIASVFAMEAGHQQAEGPGLSPEFADDKGDDFTDEQNLEEILLQEAILKTSQCRSPE
jgi:hypothetical protein